jgi:hypothetical protein
MVGEKKGRREDIGNSAKQEGSHIFGPMPFRFFGFQGIDGMIELMKKIKIHLFGYTILGITNTAKKN